MGEMTIRDLLSEGLDLCVRARKLDSQERANIAVAASANPIGTEELLPELSERHNARYSHAPMEHRSGTIPLWVQDQYERDLAAWEQRARTALSRSTSKEEGNG